MFFTSFFIAFVITFNFFRLFRLHFRFWHRSQKRFDCIAFAFNTTYAMKPCDLHIALTFLNFANNFTSTNSTIGKLNLKTWTIFQEKKYLQSIIRDKVLRFWRLNHHLNFLLFFVWKVKIWKLQFCSESWRFYGLIKWKDSK